MNAPEIEFTTDPAIDNTNSSQHQAHSSYNYSGTHDRSHRPNCRMSKRAVDASRANGARSNGPTTEEGKAITSRSSLHHGLLAEQVAFYQPQNPAEHADVETWPPVSGVFAFCARS